jgi:hypothetical protein
MGVVSVNGFRTEPGRLDDHLAAAAEALGHLRRLGLQAITLQPVAGGDIGTIASVVNYASNADHAASLQKVGADQQWQDFWSKASSGGSAVQAESSIYADVDASFQPSQDRPLGVVMATQWSPRPGRLADFMGNVMTSVPHIERMGGLARTMQCLVGAHPMTVLVTVSFPDLDAYGAYADTTATDEQWQTFWAGAMSDPTAELVRSGVYLNISGD